MSEAAKRIDRRRTPAPEKTILKACVIAYIVLFGILVVAMCVHLKGVVEEGIGAALNDHDARRPWRRTREQLSRGSDPPADRRS